MTPRQIASYSRWIARSSSMRTSAVCAGERARDDQQAARVLVEPVHDAGPRHDGEPGIAREQRVLQRAVAGCRRRGERPGRPACRGPEQVLDPRARSSSGIACGSRRALVRQLGVDLDGLAAEDPVPRPARAPSTCTSPDSIHVLSRLREYSGSRAASAWSSRWPACLRNLQAQCGLVEFVMAGEFYILRVPAGRAGPGPSRMPRSARSNASLVAVRAACARRARAAAARSAGAGTTRRGSRRARPRPSTTRRARTCATRTMRRPSPATNCSRHATRSATRPSRASST